MKSYIPTSLSSEGECLRLLSANCCLTAHKGSDYMKVFLVKIVRFGENLDFNPEPFFKKPISFDLKS